MVFRERYKALGKALVWGGLWSAMKGSLFCSKFGIVDGINASVEGVMNAVKEAARLTAVLDIFDLMVFRIT